MASLPKVRQAETADAEEKVILTDDGGSGLFEACNRRFPEPEYQVACDASHTVWVKRTDGTRSLGLPPWLLNRRSLDETLDDVESKLETSVAKR